MTDEIFNLSEMTKIYITGLENSAKAVKNEIEKFYFGLSIFTLYLLAPDYKLVKQNIRQLKNMIDPADVRLRKRDSKIDKEVKNSFYYISNNNLEIVVIGTDK